eukprot:COSAG06_NODE_2064_length_7686_cov_16.484249_7_plen_294_part_01
MKHHACQQFGARTPTRSLGIQSSLVARSPMLRSTPSGPLHRPAATSAASTGASALQPVLPACYSRKAEERSAHQMRSVDALETPQIDERAARPREASRQTAATLMSAGAAAAAAADQKMKVSEMQLQCTRGEVGGADQLLTRCCTVEQAPYRAPAFPRTCCPKGVHGLPCHRWRQRLVATQSGQSKSAAHAAVQAHHATLQPEKPKKLAAGANVKVLAALFARSLQLASGGPKGLGPLQRGLSPRRAPAESPRAGWHWSLRPLCNDRRHATGRRRCGAMVWTGPQIGSCNGVRL